MEAAPPLSSAPPIPNLVAGAAAAALYPESIDSSPRSRHTDSWEGDPPPILQQKLRFMCSYGGHIIPRPHDKSLCYIGGDTRIIVVDRHTSLSDFQQRISKTLLKSQPFLLKYQLPSEDLDALISVTSDEDLEILVEEYDRLHNAVVGGRSKPGRLRLFLFPRSASNIEQLLVESASTKSEDWFFNVLNGKAASLSAVACDRGFSESSSVNCLLGLDDFVGKAAPAVGRKGAETQAELGSNNGGNGNGIYGNIVNNHEVHSIPDSPVLETTSSFGSASSSPSTNIPPIKVIREENPKAVGLGVEEQFQQPGVGVMANVNLPTPAQKPEDVGVFAAAGTAVSGFPPPPASAVVEYGNRAVSDDERSDQGGYQKAPQIQQQLLQPQQIAQFQHKQGGASDFPSPDSISSEGSVTNPLSRQRQTVYQEPITQILSSNYRAMAISNPIDPKTENQSNSGVQMQPQVQDSVYLSPNQCEQSHPQLHQPQQYIHSGAQYYPANAVPITSYYHMYPPQQQLHQHQTELDQQYPVYFMTARPPQAYNVPLQQTSYSEMTPNPTSSHPQASRNTPATKLVQVPSTQHQQMYVGYAPMHHPSQSRVPPTAANANYTYEFADPARAQLYYTQHLPPQMAAQYQTMASGPAAMLPESSAQLENMKH
ncbi:Octicosapeptide/Phox/Bem1p family protein [Dorcoceras hygrometricum]|uniref:Octicosapeptide/Phox/Bem1p family protein n=1 Tax=Dorcoceras hygrometricum TaxID=472368 RepID=A0A2Z7C802_9LAMI|nr:Octicosapeptide/Phox/Bem1p family protein [Dorcoceras hygrometricum]